eukprot:5357928-Alexandrium_andersonii.AAC.1
MHALRRECIALRGTGADARVAPRVLCASIAPRERAREPKRERCECTCAGPAKGAPRVGRGRSR